MSICEMITELFPIRKTRKQKEAFRDWFIDWARNQGYTAQATTPRGMFHSTNVVVGDPETAEVTFTAHYDTPAAMFLPNFITPCNVLVYILYQLVIVPLLLLPGLFAGTLMGHILRLVTDNADMASQLGGVTAFFTVYAVLGLMMMGPANKHNVNDNTSGVAAVMELMSRIPEENRSKTAFILFDNEEKGMMGSSAYASSHKAVKKEKLIINMDCVGDGENILFFANKKTRALAAFPLLEEAMQGVKGRTYIMNRMEKCVYPSDQASFKHGIAVCACKKMRGIGYYCDKIHTKKDLVCEQANLDFIAKGLSDFVAKL